MRVVHRQSFGPQRESIHGPSFALSDELRVPRRAVLVHEPALEGRVLPHHLRVLCVHPAGEPRRRPVPRASLLRLRLAPRLRRGILNLPSLAVPRGGRRTTAAVVPLRSTPRCGARAVRSLRLGLEAELAVGGVEPRRGLAPELVQPALDVRVVALHLDGSERALPGLDRVLDVGMAEPVVVVLLVRGRRGCAGRRRGRARLRRHAGRLAPRGEWVG